jgi:hypothetical protein
MPTSYKRPTHPGIYVREDIIPGDSEGTFVKELLDASLMA